MTTPRKMTQVQAKRFGGPEVLETVEVPTPKPAAGQVLVRVLAASVNFADVMRRRASPYPFPTQLPFVPGSEVAGVVEALGAGVEGPPVGTAVFAVVGRDGSGGYAQFALAEAPQVIPLPPGLEPQVACGLVVAGATAVLALKEVARLQSGERVLIHAAAGGVGSFAVQMARVMGAEVFGTASTGDKRGVAARLGAKATFDSTAGDWPEQVLAATGGKGVDVILEISGGESLERGLRCLAPFGRVVVVGAASGQPHRLSAPALDAWLLNPALNQSVHAFNLGLFFGLKPDAAQRAIGALLDAGMTGALRVERGGVFPLADAGRVHRALEARQTMGKLVLTPW